MSLKKYFSAQILLILLASGTVIGAEEFSVYFKVSPRLESLYPHSDPATLSLLITGADGKPVSRGWAEVRLRAPASEKFFSTDFPLVEGSRLLDMRLPLRQGKAEWKYIFPIRGVYRLDIEFLSSEGTKVGKKFSLTIREKPGKWFFLGIFGLALFAIGLIAGRIFTGDRSTRNTAFGLCLLVSSGLLSYPYGAAIAQEALKRDYIGRLEVGPATVGKPANISWKLEGDEKASGPPVLLTLTITHLEKDKTVFAVEKIPVAKTFEMQFQFTDGTDHRITAVASVAGSGELRAEQNVSVAAVEPPTMAILPAMTFFLLIIAAGLLAGRWSRRSAGG